MSGYKRKIAEILHPRTCPVCGIGFQVRKPSSGRVYCSAQCRGVSRRNRDPMKYTTVRIGLACVGEHRLIVERFLGRKLHRDEHVHHINGLKGDNRLENLAVVSPAEHVRIHHSNHPLTRCCIICGVKFTLPPCRRASKQTCGKTCETILRKKSCALRWEQKRGCIEPVKIIRGLIRLRIPDLQISKRLGTPRRTVRKIRLGISYLHIPGCDMKGAKVIAKDLIISNSRALKRIKKSSCACTTTGA